MNHTRRTAFSVSILALLALGACAMAQKPAATTAYTAQLDTASEVPATMGSATGSVEATLATSSNVLTWKITYAGLSGPATAAHFHGPAMSGQNAGPVVPIGGSLMSPITGSATLTTSQAADLNAGKWYLNVHTAANPGGEIRGQVSVRP